MQFQRKRSPLRLYIHLASSDQRALLGGNMSCNMSCMAASRAAVLACGVVDTTRNDDEGVLVLVHSFDPATTTVKYQCGHIFPKLSTLGERVQCRCA